MDDKLRLDLERLKVRQTQLHQAVDLLGVHISAIEKRIGEEEAARETRTKAAGPEVGAPIAAPPILPASERVMGPGAADEAAATTVAGRELAGANIQHSAPKAQVSSVASSGQEASQLEPAAVAQSIATVPPPVVVAPAVADNPPSRSESFEMRLGTYWLVRIGIVAMLTALVFFGTYAYQNFIVQMGAAGKVAMLYVLSAALLGFGAWFQRKAAKESLRDFAQVLLAGGMAAVYFTTYAAHHFQNLRVIQDGVLDGALLLGWAAVMTWTADRKKSEVFAMFALGLAYYTSVITRVGHFTLYSNLILAAAVLFFLVRNRWARLSFASLVATYAGYGFWRFYSGDGWHWAGPEAGLWTGVYFIAAYWVVFTAAVFLSRHKEFADVNRATFITLNNAAFYVMFLLTMFQVRSGQFWEFNLITGAVLMAASALARLRLREEPLAANTYLTQGLLLVTVGIIAKFSGTQLALLLGLESVVLWITGTMLRNIVMRTGACVSAALAGIWAFDGINPNDSQGVWLGTGVGGLLVFNAFWSHWRGQGKSPQLMRTAPTYFSALALLIWSFAIWQNVASVNRPAFYAFVVVLAVTGIHVTRLREPGLLAHVLLPFAGALFAVNQPPVYQAEPFWVFASVVGVALGSVHWWQRQTVIEMPRRLRLVGQFAAAVIVTLVTASWLQSKLGAEEWVLATSALALAFTAYGALMRNGALPIVGQAFTMLAVLGFLNHAGSDSLPWLSALAPFGALTVLALGGRRWADSQAPEFAAASVVRMIAVWQGRMAMALLVWWTLRYADKQELVWSFTVLGAVAFGLAGWRQKRDFLVFAAVLNACALASLVERLLDGVAVYWLNFASVLVWMVEQQVARRKSGRYPVPPPAHNVTLLVSGVVLWWLGSRWVAQGFSGFYLTAAWSAFAFVIFAVGMTLRERMYRWLGLGVLGAALGRVVVFDVWKLETVYRILSFFALGLVLLVLGFIYNKYQERIRQWL